MDAADLPAVYRAHAEDLGRMLTDLSTDERAHPVPACPAWTVQEVVAHQAGVAADIVGQNMDGAPGDAWTAAQVDGRADASAEALAAELAGHAEAVSGVVAKAVEKGRPPAMLWDIATHHADLHEALDRGRLPEPMWRGVLEGRLQMLPWAQGLEADGVDGYELFRATFSRRSRSQVKALAPSLTDEQVDEIGAFGPRDDDQPVPKA